MKTYTEPSRTIPVAAEADVLVCGSGPAGIGTALGAARAGCGNVLLVESGNAVGGVSTSGMMSHWTGQTESPLLDEIYAAQAESVLLRSARSASPTTTSATRRSRTPTCASSTRLA